MAHPAATMDAQELLPRQSFHKPNEIKSGDFVSVKAKVNAIIGFANRRRNSCLRVSETMEWK
jgi:hypothetical protein